MSLTTEAPIKNKQPKYAAIASELRQQIQSQKLQIGDRLPSFDEMCEDYGVTPTTVVRVYGLLEQEGLVERQRGRGIFVAERKRPLTGNIGIVGSTSLHQPQLDYYARLMHGMENQAALRGQHLMILGTEQTWDVRSCEKVDGLLLAGIDQVDPVVEQLPPGLPAVSILTIAAKAPSVAVDDYQGAKLAVKYLLNTNHQRIACLAEELPILSRRRFDGYKDALAEEGIEAKSEWIRLTPKKSDQFYLTWGREQMQAWLREDWHKTQCTAIFVQNETAAIGVMQVLQEEGIQVPSQVSVIGFDGTQICDYVSPRLCAVEIPLEEIGANAMELLNQQINNGAVKPHSLVLPLRIREGDSVAPP